MGRNLLVSSLLLFACLLLAAATKKRTVRPRREVEMLEGTEVSEGLGPGVRSAGLITIRRVEMLPRYRG